MKKNAQWHSLSITEAAKNLSTDSTKGLSAKQINTRIAQVGLNKLPEEKGDSLVLIFLRQFKSPLIYILLGSGVIILFLNHTTDAVLIFAILVINAIVGSIQEGKAQQTLKALQSFSTTDSTVIREGKEMVIQDIELVPGDLLVLNEGDKVGADARLIKAQNLRVNEASLTGESTPVEKNTRALAKESKISTHQKTNMVFKGTYVLTGRAYALVTHTGVDTVIGKISTKIAEIETEIPLKRHLAVLSRAIIIAIGSFSVLLFVIGLLLQKEPVEMFTIVISLAIATVPEGLPVVLTTVLATGVWRMAKRNALVKKMQAVETLGQAQVIAIDKTGTITKNELVVKAIYAGKNEYTLTGVGYDPEGEVEYNDKHVNIKKHPTLEKLLTIATLSSTAHILKDKEKSTYEITGDPTEAAPVIAAQKIGITREILSNNYTQDQELPFDHKTKLHSIYYANNTSHILAVGGAPETIIERSSYIEEGKKTTKLTSTKKKELLSQLEKMTKNGLRVVAYAHKEEKIKKLTDKSVSRLTFLGFLGMEDALKKEVSSAIQQARKADIHIVMITGDHALTAKSIAKEAGIYTKGDALLTGEDIENLSEKELDKKISKTTVFARVSPEHKLTIVESFKRQNKQIAMTGDGVNDAPALVAAHLGIAMGITGTEVAKEASDIVLLDDNFQSIVAAIEEGKTIYATIQKAIYYLFSTNIGEVLTITTAILLGLPLPLVAAQILWLNLITDGFPVMALALEPKEKNILETSQRTRPKYFIDIHAAIRMGLMAITMAIGTLWIFNGHHASGPIKALTLSLTTLAVFQLANAWNIRSSKQSIFTQNPLNNKYLIAATLTVIVLQIAAAEWSPLQEILSTTHLTPTEWGMASLIGLSIIPVEELRKLIYRVTTR